MYLISAELRISTPLWLSLNREIFPAIATTVATQQISVVVTEFVCRNIRYLHSNFRPNLHNDITRNW